MLRVEGRREDYRERAEDGRHGREPCKLKYSEPCKSEPGGALAYYLACPGSHVTTSDT